jgi:hypothetical protein
MTSPHDDTTDAINVDNDPTTPLKNKTFQRPTRTRRGNPFLSFLLFLFGIVLGILATLLFIVASAHDNAPVTTPVSTQSSSIMVQVSSTYLTQLVSSKLKTAGLVGDISNVHVTMTNNNQIQITGEDTFQLLVLSVTRPFTVILQPTIEACQPHVHVISADLSDIPVTAFATTYEGQINQQIQFKSSDLPAGFTYCATNVHTDPNMLYLTYSAIPV